MATKRKPSKAVGKPRRPDTPDTSTRARARTGKWEDAFLNVLRNMGSIKTACQVAAVSRGGAYERRDTDKEFAAAWQAALDEGIDTLEDAAVWRGRDGYDKPVYQQGAQVGTVREYSDALLITLLKAHRPDKYRETVKQEHSGPANGPIQIQAVDDAIKRIYGDK